MTNETLSHKFHPYSIDRVSDGRMAHVLGVNIEMVFSYDFFSEPVKLLGELVLLEVAS